MSTKIRFLAGVAVLAVVALLASACGEGGSSSTSTSGETTTIPTPTVNSDIAAQVPADIQSKGTLTVATDPTYAPNEFVGTDGTSIEGMDPDLGAALAAVMGLKFNFVSASFDAIIPGLSSGKYNLGIASFTDTKEREQVVDFVTYFSAGTSFYVKAQGGPTINTLADLCGHTVAAERGTTQAADATAQSAKCKNAGKAGVTVRVFPDQNAATLALASGRADVGMADKPVAGYTAKASNGRFKVVGPGYGPFPYGIAIPKDNGMVKPVLDALKVLIANGQYTAILTKWGIQEGAIDTPVVNGAIN